MSSDWFNPSTKSMRGLVLLTFLLLLIPNVKAGIFSDENTYVIQQTYDYSNNETLWYNFSGTVTTDFPVSIKDDLFMNNKDIAGIDVFSANTLLTTGTSTVGELYSSGDIYNLGNFWVGNALPQNAKFAVYDNLINHTLNFSQNLTSNEYLKAGGGFCLTNDSSGLLDDCRQQWGYIEGDLQVDGTICDENGICLNNVSDGGGFTADQSLNTTDAVVFESLNTTNDIISNGTLDGDHLTIGDGYNGYGVMDVDCGDSTTSYCLYFDTAGKNFWYVVGNALFYSTGQNIFRSGGNQRFEINGALAGEKIRFGEFNSTWAHEETMAVIPDSHEVEITGELAISDLNTGGNAGSDLCVDANNKLCACGSCA